MPWWRPIISVRNAMQRVEEGDLDAEVQVYDGTELGQLQAGFNQMVHGLREREHLRDLFGRHVGKEVAAAAAGKDVELGGESRVVSVLFIDIVGSTTLAAEREPEEVVELLNRFFAVVVEEVDQRKGLVNKFIGDAALAVFGAPVELDDHAGQALAAARAMARRLAEEVPDLQAKIGVSTGEAVAGNVGEESRLRVHRDRRRGERSRPPHRAGQGRRRSPARLVGLRRGGRRRGGRPLGAPRDGHPPRPEHRDGDRRTHRRLSGVGAGGPTQVSPPGSVLTR